MSFDASPKPLRTASPLPPSSLGRNDLRSLGALGLVCLRFETALQAAIDPVEFKREKAMQRFKSPEQAQRFLVTFSAVPVTEVQQNETVREVYLGMRH